MCESMEMSMIARQAAQAVTELLEQANLQPGQILVVGCSSSEIVGGHIGKNSSMQAAAAIYSAIAPIVKQKKLYLAAQCCEHLNRAIIVEHEAVPTLDIVNVVPQPKAGSSFATATYKACAHPVAVEEIRADAGLDIGGTLIGMHLKKVAVPVRLAQDHIGDAILLAARTRPKFIGGDRAIYDESLKEGYPVL